VYEPDNEIANDPDTSSDNEDDTNKSAATLAG
jgi:hypothetical protein